MFSVYKSSRIQYRFVYFFYDHASLNKLNIAVMYMLCKCPDKAYYVPKFMLYVLYAAYIYRKGINSYVLLQ